MALGVFISHAEQDSAFAEQLASDLRRAGADVWLDATHIGPGNLFQRINQAINARDLLILILTPDAIKSQTAPSEMDSAIVRYKQGFMQSPVVVLAKPVPLRDIPAVWSVYNRIDATDSYNQALPAIAHALGLTLPPPMPSTLPHEDPASLPMIPEPPATPTLTDTSSVGLTNTKPAHPTTSDALMLSRRSLMIGAGILAITGAGIGTAIKLVSSHAANVASGRSGLPKITPSPTAIPGSLRWRFDTGSALYTSPALANGVIYIVTHDSSVYALDAGAGTKQWIIKGNRSPYETFGSPLVANGYIYIGSNDNSIYAFDAGTGVKRWKYTTGDQIWTSPVVANGLVYVGSLDGKIYALDANTGTKRWSYGPGFPIETALAVANGLVYFCGSLDGNLTDGKLYALDANTGTKRWSVNIGGNFWSSPVMANGVIYVGSGSGSVYALHANTGDQLWSVELGPGPASSPAVLDGIMYISWSDGYVYALDAMTGDARWSREVQQPFNGVQLIQVTYSPAAERGTIYLGTLHNIYALDAKTGFTRWSYPTGSATFDCTPAIANGTLYINSDDGTVYALYV